MNEDGVCYLSLWPRSPLKHGLWVGRDSMQVNERDDGDSKLSYVDSSALVPHVNHLEVSALCHIIAALKSFNMRERTCEIEA